MRTRLAGVVLLALLACAPAAAWHITLTQPAHDRPTGRGCPIGCRDTAQAAAPCVDAAAFEVWRHRQSPTWVAKRDSMLAFPAVFAHWWPVCSDEASYQLFATVQTSAAAAGQPASIAMADTVATGWFWVVVTRDLNGNRSCISNEVWR